MTKPKCKGPEGPDASEHCCSFHGCWVYIIYMVMAFIVGLALGHGCK
jgi:hypothetical protein